VRITLVLLTAYAIVGAFHSCREYFRGETTPFANPLPRHRWFMCGQGLRHHRRVQLYNAGRAFRGRFPYWEFFSRRYRRGGGARSPATSASGAAMARRPASAGRP
jgi:hypothetical protein